MNNISGNVNESAALSTVREHTHDCCVTVAKSAKRRSLGKYINCCNFTDDY